MDDHGTKTTAAPDTGWTHGDWDLDALARRVAARLPHDEPTLRSAGLGREDLLPEARLVVAELARSYDPTRGPLDRWVLGAARRAGANLARRGLGRPPAPADAPAGPAERAALRDRAALGRVGHLEPADADALPAADDNPDRATARRRLWRLVEAASRLDADHAAARADLDVDTDEPLGAVLPGTLGVLVLAAQAQGAPLRELALEVGLPVVLLASAARSVAERARTLDADTDLDTGRVDLRRAA